MSDKNEIEEQIAALADLDDDEFDVGESALLLAALDRPHCIVLRAEPYPDETEAADPIDGQRIVTAVEAPGGTLTIERHGIALRWTGHRSDTGALIDRICANRTGVVAALTEGHAAGR